MIRTGGDDGDDDFYLNWKKSDSEWSGNGIIGRDEGEVRLKIAIHPHEDHDRSQGAMRIFAYEARVARETWSAQMGSGVGNDDVSRARLHVLRHNDP